MSDRQEVLAEIRRTGVVAVVRAERSDTLIEVAKAIRAGGVTAIEITMTTPGALDVIARASQSLSGDAVIGAGSVLDPETARAAILAGAEFIVSPITNEAIIKMAKRYGKAVIPGAFTPTEIVGAWEAGGDIIKVFPATKLGPQFFSDIRGPLPQIPLTPTGGVDLTNAEEFIRAGAVALGVGGAMVKKDLIASKDYTGLTDLARQFIEAVQRARQ